MIRQITIPKPCHQQWQQMTLNDQGRHCGQCDKTVIDFSRMTDAEVIGYFSTQSNICGRLGQQQLENINTQIRSDSTLISSRSRIKTLLLGIGCSFLFFRSAAQITPDRANKPSYLQSFSIFPQHELIGKIATTKPERKKKLRRRRMASVKDRLNARYVGVTIAPTLVGDISGSVPTINDQDLHEFVGTLGGIVFVPMPWYKQVIYKVKRILRSVFG